MNPTNDPCIYNNRFDVHLDVEKRKGKLPWATLFTYPGGSSFTEAHTRGRAGLVGNPNLEQAETPIVRRVPTCHVRSPSQREFGEHCPVPLLC
jgi:hypothetical protein